MQARLVLLFIVAFQVSFAQMTRVRGKVVEKEGGEAVPFANVIFKDSRVGTITNMDGSFLIQTSESVDSIQVSYLGYETMTLPVRYGEDQYILVEIVPDAVNLAEVEVIGDLDEIPTENPAHAILRNIWARKKANSPDRMDYYEGRMYEKVEFDMNNLDSAFMERKWWTGMDFVFDYMDTSDVNGKNYLPVFITESVYDIYYRKKPRLMQKYFVANKTSGFDRESGVDEFMSTLYMDFNIYDNFLPILEKNFVSPVSSAGMLSYKYYLTDSAYIDGLWCYNIHFIPKRKKELNFKGDFWVVDSIWAVNRIEMTSASDANINWVGGIQIKQEYQLLEDTVWMLQKDYILLDFVINKGKDSKGVYGQRTSEYQNIVLNKARDNEFYKALEEESTVYLPKKKTIYGEDFWEDVRGGPLTEQEIGIYNMIDSLKEVPVFQTYTTIAEFLASGYWETQGFDVGKFYDLLAFNPIEGLRLRIGGRTFFSRADPWRVYGHVAYGTLDQRFKYGLGVKWLLPGRKRQEMGVFYKYDIEQLGQKYTNNATEANNLLSSVLAREPMDKLSLVEQMKVYYEPMPLENLRIHMELNRRVIYDAGALNFQFYSDPVRSDTLNSITTSEAIIELIYQPGRVYLNKGVDLISIYTPHPNYIVGFTKGFDGILGSDYTYEKIYLGYSSPILIPLLGKSLLAIEAGKTFGTAPYPLLEIIRGTNTYGYAAYSFNMMGFLEFVSDEYAQFFYEHHFLGLFLNKIPGLRHLNLRELITARGVIGTLREENIQLSDQEIIAPSNGYFEVGVGLENIFRVIRIDGVWRLSYMDNPGARQFGVRISANLKF
jgi:hypothetical protein